MSRRRAKGAVEARRPISSAIVGAIYKILLYVSLSPLITALTPSTPLAATSRTA
jgi:hypothetical protein